MRALRGIAFTVMAAVFVGLGVALVADCFDSRQTAQAHGSLGGVLMQYIGAVFAAGCACAVAGFCLWMGWANDG